MSTALDLRGRQVGALTPVSPTGQRDQSGSVIWVTRCDCGCEQLRSAKYLKQALATGRRCACPRCLRGRRIAKRDVRAEGRIDWMLGVIERLEPGALSSAVRTQALLRVVLDWYGLYRLGYEDREVAALADECREALGEPVDAVKFVGTPGAALEVDSGDEGGQLWSNLYPMRAPEEHGYLCAHCGETHERGWGCAECVEFVCYACGTGEVHRCDQSPQTGASTYEATGLVLGVSRERIRQIEHKAMKKIAWLIQQSESKNRVAREAARYRIVSQIPNPALEERLGEEREEQKRQREEERARRRERERENKARREQEELEREAKAQWRNRIRESEQHLNHMRNACFRQLAFCAVGNDTSKLPWRLRYPSADERYEFGNSALTAPSLEGLVSCRTCRRVILAGSVEAVAHEQGNCECTIELSERLIALVRRDLGAQV